MLKKNDQINDKRPLSGASETRRTIVGSILRGLPQVAVMIAVLTAGLLGMNWLISNKNEAPQRSAFKPVFAVETVIAKSGVWQPRMIVYGEVQASRFVDLRSLVAGQVISVNPALKVGGYIEEGEALVEIDTFTYKGQLREAKANLQETNARIEEYQARISMEASQITRLHEQYKIALSDYQRIEALRQGGTATAKQLEDRSLVVSQRRQALEQSELTLVAEQAKLEQQRAIADRFDWKVKEAERHLKDTVLKAPFSGIVSEKNAEVGRIVSVNDPLVSLFEKELLEVRFTLTDQRFGRIQSDQTGIVGREVEAIWVVGGREFRFPATIDRIGAQITSNRGGVEVVAVIDSPTVGSPLRPGAFVEVIVPDKAFEGHFRIPESAIYEDNVYVVENDQLVVRNVNVAARDGEYVVVDGELEDGDEVLTTRIAEISPGLSVTITNQEAPRE